MLDNKMGDRITEVQSSECKMNVSNSFSSEDSYNNLVIDEDGCQVYKQSESNEFVNNNNNIYYSDRPAVETESVKTENKEFKKEDSEKLTSQYLQVKTPEIKFKNPPIKSLESVVNNLMMTKFDISVTDEKINSNNNNSISPINVSYDDVIDIKGQVKEEPLHLYQSPVMPVVITPIETLKTSPPPLHIPPAPMNMLTKQELKSPDMKIQPQSKAKEQSLLSTPITSTYSMPYLPSVSSASLSGIPPSLPPMLNMAGYPMTAPLHAQHLPLMGLPHFPMTGMMAPQFAPQAMSPAMMTKTSPRSSNNTTVPKVQTTPPTYQDSAPLDLSMSTKKATKPSVEKRPISLDTDAPIDLAPKRMKTEQSELYTTPKKPAPFKPTPVASPNWYSDCLSKLASSVNTKREEVKFQKSSAFTPVAAASISKAPRTPFTSAAPGMAPFGMFSPWSVGTDTSSLHSMMGMFNPMIMTGASNPHMKFSLKDSLLYEQKLIIGELLELSYKADPMASVHSLLQHFRHECEHIESEKIKCLENIPSSESVHYDSINAYYDNKLFVCISYTKAQVEHEKKSLEMGGRLKPDSSNNLLTVPEHNMSVKKECLTDHDSSDSSKTTPPTQHSYSRTSHNISPIHSSTPQIKSSSVSPISIHNGSYSIMHSPDVSSENSSNESGFLDSSDISPSGSAQKNRRFLSNQAITILTEWYDKHSDHPYPDEDDVEILSKAANISESQVKKWMANKRVRSCNTLAFNGSIHPKKLQKLLQLKEATGDSHEETTETTTPQIPNAIASQYGGLLNKVNVANGQVIFKNGERSIVIPHKPTRKQKAKRLLDPRAVEAMNTWYQDHIDYPYPTDEEKQKLADDNGLTVAQVTCWFANKRNRSNNTRKMTPQNKFRKMMHGSPQVPTGLVQQTNNLFPGFPANMPTFPMPGMVGQN